MDILNALQNAQLDLVEMQTRLPGQDQPVYYRPMTLAQSDAINREIRAGKVESDGEKLAITLLHTVLDESGEKVFTLQHKQHLMNKVPQITLVAMVEEITGGGTIEEAEGN